MNFIWFKILNLISQFLRIKTFLPIINLQKFLSGNFLIIILKIQNEQEEILAK